FDFLVSENSPLYSILHEIYVKGDIVYYNAIAIAKDRMYDSITQINELHHNSFYNIINGIQCLTKYTGSLNSAFALARCFTRIQFLRSERGDFGNVMRTIWASMTSIFRQSWNAENSNTFKEKFGANVYHVFLEMVDYVGNILHDKALLVITPFDKCQRQLQHIPYEIANVLFDLIYIIMNTSVEKRQYFELLSTLRLVDEKISVCEKAYDIMTFVKNGLLRDQVENMIPVCTANPNVLNDIQNMTRDIRACVPNINDRRLLLEHFPGRYSLTYTEYRYAYLPRELKNIFDDAYFYFHLQSVSVATLYDTFNKIAEYARRTDGAPNDSNKHIFDYLANKYKYCVNFSNNEKDDDNPLIMLYNSLRRIALHSKTDTHHIHTSSHFDRYIHDMNELYGRLRDPNRVSGARVLAVATFDKCFLESKRRRAIALLRRLVALPLVTEYPEVNVYNQRHVLHYAWNLLLDIVANRDHSMREIVMNISPYIGNSNDITINTFLDTVRDMSALVNKSDASQPMESGNVLLMVYDYCELKNLYTKTPQQVMVYPAELRNLLIELESSLNITRYTTIYNRYFAGIHSIFKDLYSTDEFPYYFKSNPLSILYDESEQIILTNQKQERLHKWPMTMINSMTNDLPGREYNDKYSILTTVCINHLIFIHCVEASHEENLFKFTTYVNK
ncbi:unnamed protein product, partial [Ixodes pacificus]